MHIIIEGKKVEFPLPKDQEVLWKDVVDEAERFLLSVGKIPTGLRVDGKEYSQKDFEVIENEKVSDDVIAEFLVTELPDFLLQTLTNVDQANKGLITGLKEFTAKLSSGVEDKERAEVIAELQNFFGFWLRIHQLMPKTEAESENSREELKDLLGRLQKLLGDVVDSMEKKDYVLAADLFEYELIPAIETIEDVIPKLNEVLEDWKKKIA